MSPGEGERALEPQVAGSQIRKNQGELSQLVWPGHSAGLRTRAHQGPLVPTLPGICLPVRAGYSEHAGRL